MQTMAEESSGCPTAPPEAQSIARRLRLGRRQMSARSEEEAASPMAPERSRVDGDDDDEEEEDDEELPFPGYVKTACYFMSQTSQPRNYCLRLVTWPYPFACFLCRAAVQQHAG
jgi:hypothetical protein